MNRSYPSFATGTIFGERYEILSELGEGGFGVVYKARQRSTGQLVAIKIMRPPEQGNAARTAKRIARFSREMQLCAQLHHPNIVQIFDSGQTDDGHLYSVFAFAPGETLADLLRRDGALEPVEARHLMLQVLDALACAHAEGVIHRDLKPRNIMVIPTGVRRNAVVLDFGIGAMVEGTAGEEQAKLTATNEALGTLGYAAPEQLRGLDPSPRADLFSWGLVLLECLTGSPAYAGASVGELLFAQLSAEPVPMPEALAEHPLGEVLRRALNKNAVARAASARELFIALETCDMRGLLRGVQGRPAVLVPDLSGDSISSPLHTTAIASRELPAVAGPSSSPVIEGERRQITAVCCALSARAATGKELDFEEVDELFRAQLSRLADIARRHGGQIMTALGDQVLIHFGYPLADERDARRAARAALAIVALINAEGERAERERGVRLEARVGIHSGFVIVRGQGEETAASLAVGTTTKIAAALCREARPGLIAVTAQAERLLRADFALEPDGKRSLEGLGEADVFRLGPWRGRESVPPPDGEKRPLVGRQPEVNLLLERWSSARRGRGQCVLITGEPGIGKSRLTRALLERLRGEGHSLLEGRCMPDVEHQTLYPIVEMLGRALGIEQEPSPEAKIARLTAQLVQRGFTPAEAMPLFLPLFSLPVGAPYEPLDTAPQRQMELTLGALLSLILDMADERPLLVLIEDLHWADPTTVELLKQLAAEIADATACLILTARPELGPSLPSPAMLQIHLSRLEPPQIEAMVKGLVGDKALPPIVMERVVSRTDGVPLFVEELCSMLMESGLLVERADRYELTRPFLEEETPSTLRGLLTVRLDRLGRAKETAQIAAALGREFNVEVLSAISPTEGAALEEDLNKLASAGLVQRKRRLKDPGYMFKHALIRDAAYESLSRASRRKVHALIAGKLEERLPDLVAARPDLLAHHHAAAEQKARAVDYGRRAAVSALQRASLVEAITHGREAMGWLSAIDEPQKRDEAELGLVGVLAPALMMAEGYAAPSVGSLFGRAREVCEAMGAPPQLFPVLWGLGAYYAVRADHRSAAELGEACLAAAERAKDPALLVPAHLLSGGTKLWRGKFSAAHADLALGIRLHDPEQHGGLAPLYSYEPGIAARSYDALALWFLGRPDSAREAARDAEALAGKLGHFHTSIHALVRSTQLHLLLRDGPRALEQARSILEVAEEKGLLLWQHMGKVLQGWARCLGPRLEEGIADMRAGIDGWASTGADVHRAWFLTALADAHRALGRAEDGLAAVDEALALCDRTDDRIYEAESHRVRGELLLLGDGRAGHAGREAEAEASFARALETARAQEAKALELRAAMSMARLLRGLGQVERARDLLRGVFEAFDEGLDTPDLADAAALLRAL